MITFEGVKVSATAHATDQALRRVDLLRGASRQGATRWVERTTAKALIAGRRSKTMPRWCSIGNTSLPRRAKLTAPGTYRFVWNEQQTVVFAVVHSHEKDHQVGAGWVVMTVMVPKRETTT